MRLHKIEIENITSLKGKHIIDFDQIFNHTDLFAITGQTGSGKSTILSSICLALYGKNYRTTLNNADFVSYGQREGNITLEFSSGSKKYTAKWNCSVLKKNGESKKNPSPIRQLFENETVTDKTIEEIIGLDWSQFCKVVILNQGQFAEFLNCQYTERKELLEKLGSLDELKNLSKTLNKIISDLDQSIKEKTIQLDSTVFLDKAEKEKLETNQRELKKNLENNIILANENSNVNKSFLEIIELNNKIIKNNENLLRIKSEKEEAHTILAKNKEKSFFIKNEIKEIKKLIEKLAPESTKLEKVKNENLLLNEKKDEHKENIRVIQRQIDETASKIKNIEKSAITIKEKIEKISVKKDINIVELKQLIDDNRVLITNLHLKENDRQTTSQHQKDIESSANQIKDKINQLKEQFLNINNNIYKFFPKTFNDSNLVNESFQNQLFIAKKLYQDLMINSTKKDQVKRKLNETIKTIQLLEGELKNAVAKVKEFETLNHLMNTLINAKSYIRENKPKECPLCKTSIIDQNTIINDIESSLSRLSNNDSLLENLENATLLKDEIDEKVSTYRSIEKSDQFILDEIENFEASTSKNLDNILNDYNIPFKDFEIINNNYEPLKELIKQYVSISNDIKNHELNLQEKRKQYLILEDRKNKLNEEFINFLKGSSYKENDQTENKIIIDKINKENLILSEDYENFKIYKEMSKDLEIAKNNIDSVKERSKELLISQSEQIELLEKIDERINKNIDEINSICKDYNPIELLDKNKDILLETENTAIKIDKSERENELKYNKLCTQESLLLEQKIDIEQLQQSHFHIVKNKFYINNSAIPKTISDIFSKLNSIDNYSQMNQDSIDLSLIYDDILRPFFEKCSNDLNSNTQENIRIETILHENNKKEESCLYIVKEIDKLNEQKLKFEILVPLLGKDKFREFALKIVEDQLLYYANTELDKLCESRYELINPENNSRKEFYIIDHWQSGNQRKVSTLSGGETFMISLGLALGLSEMCAGVASVDCFFIDEGFGTLDSDSIQEVLDCLQQLQTRGKQIGIISHLKALTDQIPVNLRLEKGVFGQSQIDLFTI